MGKGGRGDLGEVRGGTGVAGADNRGDGSVVR